MDDELVDISTSLRLQLGYGIGHILNDVCASMWFTYFLVYFHLVLEFSASQAGTLLLIGQIVDALSTPFVGYHSDHTEGVKYGRRKVWHLFGTACVLASFPFIFSQCIGCSTTHKWAQMFYFAAFITVFQIGWAAVQISHLSLIPELSDDDHTRTHLTAIRFGCTVFSNLFVYIVTWIVLRVTGDESTNQIGPADAWKFRHVVYIVMSVGLLASIVFHISVKEKRSIGAHGEVEVQPTGSHSSFFKKPLLYQIGGIYMSTRLVVNVSQVLVPLYLHATLKLSALSLAVVPLTMYIGSLTAAAWQRLAPRSMTRKLHYFIGAVCALSAFLWIYFGSDENYKTYLIYVVALLIGFGGAVMVVTSLALTADLVGAQTGASAFVYGLMSFSDKLSCGVAIALIQQYADGSPVQYYRYTLSCVCAAAALAGLLLTLLLPKTASSTPLLINDEDDNSTHTIEDRNNLLHTDL